MYYVLIIYIKTLIKINHLYLKYLSLQPILKTKIYMLSIEQHIKSLVIESIKKLYNQNLIDQSIQVQKTRKEFEGDYTVVIFPFTKISRKNPEITGQEIGEFCISNSSYIKKYNVIKGFLNIEINDSYWFNYISNYIETHDVQSSIEPQKIMIEFSSPNTNKPLHLGHIRNNLIGNSISNILKAVGHNIIKVNLVNDRGIHICKSMIAWQKFGNGETPQSSNKKGDHLVGDYYVLFDKEYKKQVDELIKKGTNEEEAKKQAPILLEAQEMLRKWEAKDPEILKLWETMNNWVYEGFDKTYERLGITFDRIYYESQTYELGKNIVLKGLHNNILYKKDDGSIWADLTEYGLDHKVLLRSDGTSVYMTQDIGTAHQRFEEYHIDKHIYVVGNEQNYHFQALIAVLNKLGFDWANKLVHLSYGMVELPEGKMKSREGTVVDADDLMDEMTETAYQMSKELGKLDGLSNNEKNEIIRMIGMGALKYFILKVDPKKNMIFDPKESIDFNGNTGPFIQYTYARINSLIRKAEEQNISITKPKSLVELKDKEKELIKLIYDFPYIVASSAEELNPAVIANYCYELSKTFNQFYHEFPILKEKDEDIRQIRLILSKNTSKTLYKGMNLLGIELPDRM